MQKKKLINIEQKINLNEYSTKDYFEFLSNFRDTIISIKYKDNIERTIKIKVDSTQLSHLLGLQYAYDNKNNKKYYKGKLAIETLNKISFKDIKFNINKNRIKYNKKTITWDNDIKPRFEYLPYALNTICSKFSLRIQKPNKTERLTKTVLKGKYFYYKSDNKHYLIFSIAEKNGFYYFESFFVNDGLILLGNLEKLDVIEVKKEIIS